MIEDCVETGKAGQVIQSIYDIVKKGYFACIQGHCNLCQSDQDCEPVRLYKNYYVSRNVSLLFDIKICAIKSSSRAMNVIAIVTREQDVASLQFTVFVRTQTAKTTKFVFCADA